MPTIWVRNHQAADLLEPFLISAITSLLLIRFFLGLTGYPQLSGLDLHIAHMLWGGLCMMIALGISFTFLSKTSQKISAVIGGAGFGIFIDELGKFITQDNNYFYKPTIALVYSIFLALFLLIRFIQTHQHLTPREALVNALRQMEEAASDMLDPTEHHQIKNFLAKADPYSPLTKSLTRALRALSLDHNQHPSIITQVRKKGNHFTHQLMNDWWFNRSISVYFLAQAGGILIVTSLYTFYGLYTLQTQPNALDILFSSVTIEAWGQFISSAVSSILVICGALIISRSRLQALTLFKYSELVAIFITQFFAFYQEQLSAIFGLLLHVCLLVILNYLIRQERRTQHTTKLQILRSK